MAKIDDTVDVIYWPNGVWCYRHELEQMTHMSDDFTLISVSSESSPDEIYEMI